MRRRQQQPDHHCQSPKDRWVRNHRGIAAAYVVLRMSLSSIIKQPTAGTLSWRFMKLASRRVCQGNAVAAFIIRLMVAGLCHHFLVNRSVKCVAWLVFVGGIARIASELECTAGNLAMLCLRMHELQLL